MLRRISFVIILFAMIGGAVSGMPLRAPNSKMEKCCEKAKSKIKTASVKAAGLCCAVNCSDPVPTNSNTLTNFAPLNFSVSKSIADQIAALFANERPAPAPSI
ncbi:MAG: hypothetical protein ABIV48_02085, partial [Pyrinomonadaceae bacterium]